MNVASALLPDQTAAQIAAMSQAAGEAEKEKAAGGAGPGNGGTAGGDPSQRGVQNSTGSAATGAAANSATEEDISVYYQVRIAFRFYFT